MDLTLGMRCPSCKTSNSFIGGRFGSPITQVNYTCNCGFSAVMLIPRKGYGIEYKSIKDESPAEDANNFVQQLKAEIVALKE
jgi:hypothetical protein